MADRDAILEKHFPTPEGHEDAQAIKYAMDSYMEATCLELLEYMARKGIICFHDEEGFPLFKYKGEELTAEQLFAIFL